MSLIDLNEFEQQERQRAERLALADIIVRGLKSKYPGHEIGPAHEKTDSRGVTWTHIPVAKVIYEQVYTEIGFHPLPRYTIDELKDEKPLACKCPELIPNAETIAAMEEARAGNLEEVGDISDLFKDRYSD